MKQIRRIVLLAIAVLVVLYGADYIAARFRIPPSRETLGSVQVQTLWAIKQKDGRIDYELGDTETETCIRSLFPHLGYPTCWYLSGHTHKTIKVGQLAPHSVKPGPV